MPGKDGNALVRELRQREADAGRPPLPAVALTAYDQLTDQAKGLRSGFDEYLGKPVDPKRLVTVLERLLGRR
jgi:CheY-like chemotaxis protein